MAKNNVFDIMDMVEDRIQSSLLESEEIDDVQWNEKKISCMIPVFSINMRNHKRFVNDVFMFTYDPNYEASAEDQASEAVERFIQKHIADR